MSLSLNLVSEVTTETVEIYQTYGSFIPYSRFRVDGEKSRMSQTISASRLSFLVRNNAWSDPSLPFVSTISVREEGQHLPNVYDFIPYSPS